MNRSRKPRGLAVALAFLAYMSRSSDRYQFDRFWQSLRRDFRTHRAAEASSSLNGIYEAVGRRRETKVMTAFEQAAQQEYGPLTGYPGNR